MQKKEFSRMRLPMLIKLIGFVFIGTTLLTGCGGGSDNGQSGNGTPVTPPTSSQGVLSSATVLISQQPGTVNPMISQTDTTLVLRGVRKEITAGKIILSTVGKGALRKVVSTDTSTGNTVLTTTQASVEQAFDSLHVKASPAFSQTQMGNITSKVPGLSFEWVDGTSASGAVKSHAIEKNKLKINFAGLEVSSAHGITIDGSATLDANPEFDCDINRAPGDLLPSVASLKAGMSSTFHGNLIVKSKYGGSLTASKTLFDEEIGEPIVVGWLVFVPSLKIESSISGTAAGSVTHTNTVDLTASGYENYTRGTGWTSSKQLTPSMTATDSEVDAEYGVTATPVAVTLSLKLYDIAGPYIELHDEIAAEGTHTVQQSVEGVLATVTAGSGGEIGLSASTPAALKELFEASWTPLDVTFKIDEIELFRHFFPFTGASSISVGDNGNLPDDIFAVSVDNIALGQTDKGGTGAFRVTSLSPGSHTLTITCLDDGANGTDVGTLGIVLSDGITFADASTTLSDELAMNETRNYTIIVPSAQPSTHSVSKMPKNTHRIEHSAASTRQ